LTSNSANASTLLSIANSAIAIQGYSATSTGVQGASGSGVGVYGQGTGNQGAVFGHNVSTTGGYGVFGLADGDGGSGVLGQSAKGNAGTFEILTSNKASDALIS